MKHLCVLYIIASSLLLPLRTACHGASDSTAPEPNTPSFTLKGGWMLSTIRGLDEKKKSYYTDKTGATATWKPGFTAPITANVSLYHVVYDKDTDDPGVAIAIAHASGTSAVKYDTSMKQAGWQTLGTYSFSGTQSDRVELTKTQPGGTARVTAVKFDVLSDANGKVIRSFILDTATAGDCRSSYFPPVSYNDLEDSPLKQRIESLNQRGFLTGVSPEVFGKDLPASPVDFTAWALRAAGRLPRLDRGAIKEISRDMIRAAAIKTGWGDPGLSSSLSPALADKILTSAATVLGRTAQPSVASSKKDLSRLEAAQLYSEFLRQQVEQGPLPGSKWKLVFQDEFSGGKLDETIWQSDASSPHHILSSRWPENVQVAGGLLHLLTKKESRGGREWTTGNIWTRTYLQKYGFFECRMKIAKASGLNNAFWMMPKNQPGKTQATFEIDVTEAHYPSEHTATLHHWSAKTSYGSSYLSPVKLSDDFHIYSCLWTPNLVVFYIDGDEVNRVPQTFANEESPIYLSTAVGQWAGKITDALDGTEMQVDWVRAYQPENGFSDEPIASSGN